MPDEAARIILAETAITAIEGNPNGRRKFFRCRNRQRKQSPKLTHCENCGAPLAGGYCAQCGQPAIDYRRSFRHVLVDVLDSFLNWDSKFLSTIVWLLICPWRLTNEFLAGRRARYFHPLRLYLLASILFFFAVNYWAKSLHLDTSKMSEKDRVELQAELKKENLPPEARAQIEKALNLRNVPPEVAMKMAEKMKRNDSTAPASATPLATSSPEEDPKENANTKSETERPMLHFGPKNPTTPLEKWLQDRAKEKIGEHGTNAQLFLMTVFSNLPYMMLCCIPLFAFVLKILYLRKRIFYIDHLVYALNIHTFAYLSIILIVPATIGLFRVVPPALAGWLVGLLWFTFAVQIFLSIRRVYRQGWFFSIFKFLVGGFVYLFVLCIALAATFFITLALPS
jgi:uncharacterized protein DUF3667